MALKEGTYIIESKLRQDSVFDVLNFGPDEAAVIFAYKSVNPDFTQQWAVKLIDASNETYTIQNVTSKQYLAVDGDINRHAYVNTEQSAAIWQITQSKDHGAFAYRIHWPGTQFTVAAEHGSPIPGARLWLVNIEPEFEYFNFIPVAK